MSLYSLPKYDNHDIIGTDFRPSIPVYNSTKELCGLFQEQFVLIIIDYEKLRYCKKLTSKLNITVSASQVILLYYNLNQTELISKLTEYITIDFCEDYLDTFNDQLVAFTTINCFSNGETIRVIEINNPIEIISPDQQAVDDIQQLLKSTDATSYKQLLLGLGLATVADKRNFPYSTLWTVIDPYDPDWRYWAMLYASFGFCNPELVTATPTGSALNTEMIKITRSNNYTGKVSGGDISKIRHYQQAILKCLKLQTVVFAIKWKQLGIKLRQLVTDQKGVHGSLFLATNKSDQPRALRLGDVNANLMMWPLAIESNTSICGLGLPFQVLTETFLTARHLWQVSMAAINNIVPASIFVTNDGIYLLQCTSDYKTFLLEVEDYKNIEQCVCSWQQLSINFIRNLRFRDLPTNYDCKHKRNSMLFRIGYYTWDQFAADGIVFSYLFGQDNCKFKYNSEQIV